MKLRNVVGLRDSYAATSALGLFLLPGGRPRLFAVVTHAGGRPRRFPCPRASRSSAMIASSICARSVRSSSTILMKSIGGRIAQTRPSLLAASFGRHWSQISLSGSANSGR
jgi:hypothetical protein